MLRCTNKKCPIRTKCKRFVGKVAPDKKATESFDYKEIKNPDGITIGYICELQIPI